MLQEGFNPDGQKFEAKQQKVIWQMYLPCEEVRLVIFEWAQMFKFIINQTRVNGIKTWLVVGLLN
jgi:hypothetical protein